MITESQNTSQILDWAKKQEATGRNTGILLSMQEANKHVAFTNSSDDLGFSRLDKNAIATAPLGWKVRGANRIDGKESHIVSSGLATVPHLYNRVPLVGPEIYSGAHTYGESHSGTKPTRQFKSATIVENVDHWPTEYLADESLSGGSRDPLAAKEDDVSIMGVHANNAD